MAPGPVTVGVIANPASGRDIRRLVSGASVFDNAEKGSMIYRFVAGLRAAGVERALIMPAFSGVYESLERNLRSHRAIKESPALPHLEYLDMHVQHDAHDTIEAVNLMLEQRVGAIGVLGGDGTNRIVARHCADVPLCALSTGTNNAFPEMREATVAGLATGLVATGRVGEQAVRQEKILRVGLDGDPRHDCALVDVAVSSERFVGSRALWKVGTISEIFVTFASPESLGLSSVAGLLEPISRQAPYGLHVRLAAPTVAESVLRVPFAPGLVIPVGVGEAERLEPGKAVRLETAAGSLALDGERELEVGPANEVEVRLDLKGPLTIDVGAAMREASFRGLLNGRAD